MIRTILLLGMMLAPLTARAAPCPPGLPNTIGCRSPNQALPVTSPTRAVALFTIDGRSISIQALLSLLGTGDLTPLLGPAATRAIGTTAGTLMDGGDSRVLGALQGANNLSDLVSPSAARTSLGLGALSTLGIGAGLSSAGGNLVAAVISVLGRTGAVTLLGADITGALGFTPYSASNPMGYIAASGAPVQSVAGRTGAVTLGTGDVAGFATAAAAPVQSVNSQTGTVTVPAYTLPAATASALGGVRVSTGLGVDGSGNLTVAYGTAAGTAAQGNDSRITGALQAGTAATTYLPLTGGTLTGALNVNGTLTGPTLALTGAVAQSSVLAGPAGASGAPAHRKLAVGDVTGAAASGANADITSIAGLITPLSAAQGGTGGTGGAWAATTPTPTAASGTFTTVAGALRYSKVGRVFTYNSSISITTNGSAAGSISLPMPFASAGMDCTASGRESTTGKTLIGIWGGGTSSITIYNTDVTYPGGDGKQLRFSGTCETAS